VFRHRVQRQDCGVGEVRYAVDAGHRRHRGAAAGIDEHVLCGKAFIADRDLMRGNARRAMCAA
jgi:hypothetical protein